MNGFIEQFSAELQGGGFSFLLLIISFLGGTIASLSPCTLGIIPVIVGYVVGYDKEKSSFHTFLQMMSFVLGLSVILTMIGIFCAATGRVFMAIGGNWWIIIMASLIMIFGLNLLGVIELPTPVIVKRMPKSKGASLFVYPFILGFLFALAATPCSTPILAGIMSFATLSQNFLYAALLLLCFSLGQGVIIILAGVFTSIIKNLRGVNNYTVLFMKLCGILLIISSILIFYKVFSPYLKFN